MLCNLVIEGTTTTFRLHKFILSRDLMIVLPSNTDNWYACQLERDIIIRVTAGPAILRLCIPLSCFRMSFGYGFLEILDCYS